VGAGAVGSALLHVLWMWLLGCGELLGWTWVILLFLSGA
jgi:hypothetical protein